MAVTLTVAVGISMTAVAADSARPPTPHELRVIKRLISLSGVTYVRVSTVDSSYIAIFSGPGGAQQGADVDQLLSGGRVRSVYGFASAPRDGACAFAPAAVVTDLLGVRCPPWRALHARRASAAERDSIRAAWGDEPLRWVCISRLDPHWAAAIRAFPSTAGVIWFHKQRSRWHSVYDTFDSKGVLPSHAIVLSLAACVGYNAAEYGG